MDPYIGEIRMFAGNFAPTGWAFCDGQVLPINQNTALFSLLGTYYGGNGTTNFALPNLQNASPMDQGNGPGLTPRTAGETGGEWEVALNQTQLPSHTHGAMGTSTPASVTSPAGNQWAAAPDRGGALYSDVTSGLVPMSKTAFSSVGASSPHNNMPPYLTVSFIIALQGVFPSRG